MTRTIRRRETLGLFAPAASTTTYGQPVAAHGGGAIDLPVTPDGEQPHLPAARSGPAAASDIGHGGRLQAPGAVGGLSAGSAGLAMG